MRLNGPYIRSLRGQLSLLAAVYLGAVVLAIAAGCGRTWLFEPYIHERFPPVPNRLAGPVRDLAEGKSAPEQLEEVIAAVARQEAASEDAKVRRQQKEESSRARLLDAVYGTWIEDAASDPHGRLAAFLLSEPSGSIIERIRQTLVLGDERQRSRAMHLLRFASTAAVKPEAMALCAYARQRAQRRREPELVRQADAVLQHLEE
jgi:hypothetical protein